MLPVHTILHPTDFSAQSGYALRLAGALARDYGARLVLLHVALPPMPVYGGEVLVAVPASTHDEERQHLDRLKVPDGVPTERRLVVGVPVEEILGVASEVSVDLIVMGTHGRTGLARLLMGSVAEQVVRKARCPVLTVKTPFPEALPLPGLTQEEAITS
jgi:nucleotide-binding universal stress UspA family protein